jgi:GR25 family glycosyltransferase involved in LPS biosynthesis
MKAFIISLSKIETSAKSANEVLTQLTDYGFDACLFEGTYGNDAVTMFTLSSRQIHREATEENFKNSSPGVKGCFHSHYRLWEKCVELNEDIAIFEDDVVFYRNYDPVEFDEILVVSINYDWKIYADEYKHLLESESAVVESLNFKGFYMPGCSGYIIKPVAARRLIETYQHSYLPADWAINSTICKIKIHSRLIGRSKTMKEKESMTRFKGWLKK